MSHDTDRYDNFDIDGIEEIALPRFEDDLGRRLAAAHAGHQRQVDPADLRDHRDHHGRGVHRRRAARSLTVGAGTIAAAAALVVAVAVWPRDDSSRPDAETAASPTTSTTTAPSTTTASSDAADALAVVRVAVATEAATSGSVLHITHEDQVSRFELWSDQTSDRWILLQTGAAGDPWWEAAGGDGVTRVVDHCSRLWSETPGDRNGSLTRGPTQGWARNLLQVGALKADGTEELDGRELFRLTELPIEAIPGVEARDNGSGDDAANDDGHVEPDEVGVVLVDPDTHLPVRYIGNPDTAGELVQTYTYLPRTAENLALLDLAVPEGYAQDTNAPNALPGDDLSAQGGCA
jgi:hypothetical protein